MARIWPAYGPHMGRVGTSHTHTHTFFPKKDLLKEHQRVCCIRTLPVLIEKVI